MIVVNFIFFIFHRIQFLILRNRLQAQDYMNKSYPTYLQALLLLVVWLLSTIAVVLFVILFESYKSALGMAIVYSLSMLLTMAAGFFLRKSYHLLLSGFSIGLLLLATLLIFSVHILLEPLRNFAPIPETLIAILMEAKNDPYSLFFMLVIAAPLLEEILFRGIILDGFLKNYKPAQGILISALMFAVIHGNLAQGIGAFAIGIILGWLYWKTNSLSLCMALHAINNLTGFIGILTTPTEDIMKDIQDSINNDMIYFVLYGTALIMAATIVWYLYMKWFKAADSPNPISND